MSHRHVYGPGSTELKQHPNEFMRALFEDKLFAIVDGVRHPVEKVQWYNGGSTFKVKGKWRDELGLTIGIVDQR